MSSKVMRSGVRTAEAACHWLGGPAETLCPRKDVLLPPLSVLYTCSGASACTAMSNWDA